MATRDNYFSFMKGLGIIAVLFIHTPFMNGDGAAAVACRQLFTFAVALFFFLSGYFVKDGHLDLKGIKRIFIPYVIWSLLWFVETTAKGTQPVTIWKIVNSLFFGGAFFPLYFLVVLIELKFLTPWMVRHIKGMMRTSRYCFYKDWALLVTPAMLLVLYIVQYHTRQQPLIYAQIFPTWFLFYYVGSLMKFGYFKGDVLTALCCTLFGLYLSLLESAYINEVIDVPFWAVSQIKFSAFFYSLSFCVLLMTLHREVKRTWIVCLGELSFGIYLLHIPVMRVTTSFLNKTYEILSIDKMEGGIAVNQLLIILITLTVCYSILIVTNKYLPVKISRYLGFR